VLIIFNFEHKRTFISIINEAIRDFPLDLNFREAYFQKRKKHPYPNLSSGNKKRLLIHIRQGDTATIKTPWNTYFSVWDQHKKPYQECNLVAGLADSRTFKRPELFKFSKSQFESLKISSKVYEEEAFKCFAKNLGIRLNIGETPENLKALIHELLHSDIIVSGTQNRMIPKFLSLYFNETEMPVLILLFKERKPYLKSFGFSDQNSRIICVDINNYNPEEVLEKIKAIPILNVK
jgi:hypothetical protein